MNEKIQKLLELLGDEAIAPELKTKDVNKALSVLKENGLEMTEAELKESLEFLLSMPEDGELTLEEADAVAGGRFTFKDWWRGEKQVIKGFFDELFGW